MNLALMKKIVNRGVKNSFKSSFNTCVVKLVNIWI